MVFLLAVMYTIKGFEYIVWLLYFSIVVLHIDKCIHDPEYVWSSPKECVYVIDVIQHLACELNWYHVGCLGGSFHNSSIVSCNIYVPSEVSFTIIVITF